MLELLHRIVHEVNDAPNLERALEIIVHRVKQAIHADVCSVYLTDVEKQEHILMATDGLHPESVGRVRVPMGQGLIGFVSNRSELLNLDNAEDHPNYLFNDETGEAVYHGFLGVPIIQHRKVLGILVVRRRQARRFEDQDVTCIVTLAAQLAGAITHAKASGELERLQGQGDIGNRFFEGRPGAPGIAIGKIVVAYPAADLNAVPNRSVSDPEREVTLFRDALAKAVSDLNVLAERMEGWLPEAEYALFDAWLQMMQSHALVEEVVGRIHNGNWAQGALRDTIRGHTHAFEQMDDAYLRERAGDIHDIGQRILKHLQSDNHKKRRDYPAQTILAGEDLSALELAEIPRSRLAGVISTTGSKSSHVAILASGMGVPAVMGVTDLPLGRMEGLETIVDGHHGRIYALPAPSVLKEYQRLLQKDQELEKSLDKLRGLQSKTLDNHILPLFLNTGLVSETRPMGIEESAGVGLYRTELPFMVRDSFPSEMEQAEEYRQVLTAFYPRSVTFRTLDIGGDKCLPYFPIAESNPFLGWRGIRISLDQPNLFLTQVRAIMRAALGMNNARILLPMISLVEEVDQAQELIHRAYKDLVEEELPVAMPQVGAMVEVPAVVYQIEALAQRVDFLSVGTNDLTQYLLAVDRNNRVVAGIYDDLHPAILRALCQIVRETKRQQREVSVCGEMAGNPLAAALLLGMGMHSLSMNAGSLLPVKAVIRAFTVPQARDVLRQTLACDTAVQVRNILIKALESVSLGYLVR